MFSCEFCDIFKNAFFIEQPQTTTSGHSCVVALRYFEIEKTNDVFGESRTQAASSLKSAKYLFKVPIKALEKRILFCLLIDYFEQVISIQ